MFSRIALILAFSLLLGACGSSPPVDFYALQPMKATNTSPAEDGAILGLGPLTLPAYLQRPQLVTLGEGNEVSLDEFSRWAEPLETALPRVLSMNVDQLMDAVMVVAFPWQSTIEADYRLVGRVSTFTVNEAGLAILQVQWGVRDSEGEMLVQPRRDRFEAQATEGGDPAAAVAALNLTVDQYSREIAQRLSAALAAN